MFTDPDRFDVTRTSTQPMLTFGGGIHYCLGVHLAKAELVEALSILTQRWATVRAAGPSPWKPVNGITGPVHPADRAQPGWLSGAKLGGRFSTKLLTPSRKSSARRLAAIRGSDRLVASSTPTP